MKSISTRTIELPAWLWLLAGVAAVLGTVAWHGEDDFTAVDPVVAETYSEVTR